MKSSQRLHGETVKQATRQGSNRISENVLQDPKNNREREVTFPPKTDVIKRHHRASLSPHHRNRSHRLASSQKAVEPAQEEKKRKVSHESGRKKGVKADAVSSKSSPRPTYAEERIRIVVTQKGGVDQSPEDLGPPHDRPKSRKPIQDHPPLRGTSSDFFSPVEKIPSFTTLESHPLKLPARTDDQKPPHHQPQTSPARTTVISLSGPIEPNFSFKFLPRKRDSVDVILSSSRKRAAGNSPSSTKTTPENSSPSSKANGEEPIAAPPENVTRQDEPAGKDNVRVRQNSNGGQETKVESQPTPKLVAEDHPKAPSTAGLTVNNNLLVHKDTEDPRRNSHEIDIIHHISSDSKISSAFRETEGTIIECSGEKRPIKIESFDDFLRLEGLFRPWYDFATQMTTTLVMVTKSTSVEAAEKSASTQATPPQPSSLTTVHEVQVDTSVLRRKSKSASRGAAVMTVDGYVNTDEKDFKRAARKIARDKTQENDARDVPVENEQKHMQAAAPPATEDKIITDNHADRNPTKNEARILNDHHSEQNSTNTEARIPNGDHSDRHPSGTEEKILKDHHEDRNPSVNWSVFPAPPTKGKSSTLIGLPIILPQPGGLLGPIVTEIPKQQQRQSEVIKAFTGPSAMPSIMSAPTTTVVDTTAQSKEVVPKSSNKLRPAISTNPSERNRSSHRVKFNPPKAGPAKSEILKREQISARISSLLQEKESTILTVPNKVVVPGEARRLNKNFIREKILLQEAADARRAKGLKAPVDLQSEPRIHKEDHVHHGSSSRRRLSSSSSSTQQAQLMQADLKKSLPEVQTTISAEYNKLIKYRRPIVWNFGYTQVSIAKKVQDVLSQLADIFQLHEISLDIEVTKWATSPRFHKLSVSTVEPSSFSDAIIFRAAKILRAVKEREGKLQNFSSLEICKLLKLAILYAQAMFKPKGYILRNFPITAKEGDDFEAVVYPCATGLYFSNNKWTRDKSSPPEIVQPRLVSRSSSYNEAEAEALAEHYGERTIKVSNMNDHLTPAKLHEIAYAMRHNFEAYSKSFVAGVPTAGTSSDDRDGAAGALRKEPAGHGSSGASSRLVKVKSLVVSHRVAQSKSKRNKTRKKHNSGAVHKRNTD